MGRLQCWIFINPINKCFFLKKEAAYVFYEQIYLILFFVLCTSDYILKLRTECQMERKKFWDILQCKKEREQNEA